MTQITSVWSDESLETDDGGKAKFTTSLTGTEILTYTYRF